MKMATPEYFVIGFSLAGIAAAERLAKTSSVGILDYVVDTGSVDELLRGPLTVWAPQETDGVEFQVTATRHLEQMGVQRFSGFWPDEVESDDRGLSVVDSSTNRRFRCRGLVFAPNGSEPGLPDSLKAESLIGYGITYCGLADIVFAKNEDVAVFGCGARSLQEVKRASRFCPRVYWICSGHLDVSLRNEVRGEHRVEVLDHAQLVALTKDSSGLLRAIGIRRDDGDTEIPVKALVVAQDLLPLWNLFGDMKAALDLVRRGRLVFAGIAAGVRYDDPTSLWASGEEAAVELLGWQGRDEGASADG